MHHVDRSTPWEEIWQAMEQLVQSGKVLYVGSSNFAGWHLAHAQGEAARRGFLGLVSEQSLYNLNARMIELEVVPACRTLGLGLLPWSPLAGGLLGGVLSRADTGRRASDEITKSLEKHRPRIEAYEALCREIGAAPGDVALAWVLANPVVTAPIIGPREPEQLASAVRALGLALEPQVMERLNAIFPGPGGEAPESYAW